MVRWFDDHCHLDPATAAETVAAARAAGVEALITVGTDLAHSQAALQVARAYDGVWATAGVHPHDASGGIDGIADLLDAPEIVAVGECGFDFHYDHSPRDVQEAVFAAQVALANEHDLALVIHTREAWDETFAVLDREGTPERTIFHCFTGGSDEARACLERGAHLSFSGIVTFKNADDVRGAARVTPLDRMLVETDSPYLAPVPKRGQPNQPANVVHVGEAIAALCEHDLGTVAQATWDNAHRAYGLDTT